ncbi:MAG TPA: alpha/beta hydrolase [Noviherbaspirillum sp.]
MAAMSLRGHPPGVETLRIATDWGEIAVRLQGDPLAPPVYMAHPILLSSAVWDAQAALLAQQGLRMIRADLRGHGASSAPPAPYMPAELVADVLAVLDALELRRVHVVGLLLGAVTGLGLAIRHPQRVASLCLCSARADGSAFLASTWDERIALATEQGVQAVAQESLQRWLAADFPKQRPDEVTRLLNSAAETSLAGYTGCAAAVQLIDYLPDTGGIEVPSTLIVGTADAALAQASRDIQRLLPGAAYEEIPQAGHLPNIDQADAFNAALLRHFERVVPAFTPPARAQAFQIQTQGG